MRRPVVAPYALFVATVSAYAQTPSESEAHRVHKSRVEYLTRGSGRWRAANPSYDAANRTSIEFFAYRFTRDTSPDVLRLEISGGVGTQVYAFWNGYYFWHPVRNRVMYQALAASGMSGGIISGESVDEVATLLLEVIAKDGSIEWHRDEERRVNDNEFVSTSYRLRNGKWELNQRLTWKRQ